MVVSMLDRLATASFRRRGRVILLWVLGVVALSLVAPLVADDFSDGATLPGTDSQRAYDLLEREFGDGTGDADGEEITAVFRAPDGIASPEARAAVEDYLGGASQLDTVVGVVSPFDDPARISPDGTTAYATLEIAPGADEVDVEKSSATLQERAGPGGDLAAAGITTGLDGDAFWDDDMPASEIIGLAVAAVVLLVTFGSVVAMGLPIVTALVGVGAAVAGVSVWTAIVPTPDAAVQVAVMMGLGVGIDYALFVITRYRRELVHRAPTEALAVTMGTAGRAVVFAGSTVIVSLLGIVLAGLDFLQGLALGAATAVLIAVAAAVTLLPALLSFATGRLIRSGARHERRRARRGETLWHRWGGAVRRRPVPIAAAGLVLLVVLAAPVAAIRLSAPTAESNPEGNPARTAYELTAEGFGPGANGPLVVVATGAAPASAAGAAGSAGGTAEGGARLDPSALAGLERAIAADAGVATVGPARTAPSGTAAMIEVTPTTAPDSSATRSLVHRLRSEIVPASGVEAHVGGATASDVDFTDRLSQRLPIVIGAVLAVSFLLLLVVFRSILVPLKAVAMNLLSIGAAYGVVVAVFQWGWGAGPLGVEAGPIESWIPMLMFAIVFGLSMDYEVFLLSAVREEYDRTGDSGASVVEGLSATARVITAAATIMVAVFGAFALADLRAITVIGVGLATAVLIDATVVRMVLVPATMELLGDRNWWIPRWLDRVLPRVAVEKAPVAPAPGQVPPAPVHRPDDRMPV
jgi:RND superfamily putative drug exporter